MIETVLNIPARKNEIVEQSHVQSVPNERDPWADLTRDISRHGDEAAFTKYYQTFFDTMFMTVKRTTGRDEATCLDIVQDAMVKAIGKMKPMSSRDQTAAWTVVVAKTTAYDFLRKEKRRQQRTNTLGALSADQNCSPAVETEVDSEARLAWIEEQLLHLPDDLKSMIDLKYRMGWTLKQIAHKFGLKAGAVDGRIRRAVEGLKTQAATEFDDE